MIGLGNSVATPVSYTPRYKTYIVYSDINYTMCIIFLLVNGNICYIVVCYSAELRAKGCIIIVLK